MSLIDKAKAVAVGASTQSATTAGAESKTIKFNTCLSDDQDSDTIKFEDAINDSEASTKKRLLGIDASKGASRLKESQGSAGVIISSTEIATEEEKKEQEQDNSDEVRTTKEGLDTS